MSHQAARPRLGLPAQATAPAARREGPAAGGAWTVTVVAMIAFVGALDRQTLASLLVPIQKDIHVSDAAMGFLAGSTFSLVYAFAALPMARLADRTDRRRLLSIAVAVWSVATIGCGLARSFLLLLAARIGVGIGEAPVLPAAMSLFGDLAPADRRGTPIGVFNAGIALGFASGGLIGGALNDRFGWHVALMAVALPGLVLSAVMFFTVREPVRGAQDGGPGEAAREPLLPSLRRVAAIRTLLPFVIGYVCLNLCYNGWLIWLPPFLMRAHHLSATAMGTVFAPVVFGGVVAVVVGGKLSDLAARRAPRWRLYFCCVCGAIAVPLLAASTLVASLPVAIACMLGYSLIGGSLSAVSQASYLSVAPAHLRGTVTAVMNILALGFGAGLAPVLYGAVNDVLKPTYGDQSLRYTLLIAPLMMAAACVMYLIASRTMDKDVARVAAPSAAA